MDSPTSASTILTLSKIEFRLVAEMSPIPMPNTMEITMAATASSMVLGKRMAISWATGRPVRKEVPKSPRRALLM